jgi:hypothetical protein
VTAKGDHFVTDSKFAPITASLLARKGDAGPSVLGSAPAFDWAPPRLAQRVEMPRLETPRMQAHVVPITPAPPPVAAGVSALEKVKRISVALSHSDHERLGIASVKRGLSRHQIVRDALEHYFENFAHELNDQCRCMAEGTGCQGRCV